MRRIASVALLVVGPLLWGACESDLESGMPELPPGFLDADIPTGDLSGYLFFSDQPLPKISLSLLGSSFATASATASIWDMSVWFGPNIESFGGIVDFKETASAEVAQKVLSSHAGIDAWRESGVVLFVRGGGEWAADTKASLHSETSEIFQEAFPDAWDLMTLMPSDPPAEPVAAGFTSTKGGTLDHIASKTGLDLGGLGQAFGVINVSQVAFVAYSDDTINIPAQVDRAFLFSSHVGVIMVAESSYPGALLSAFLSSFSDQMGLSDGLTIGGEEVLSRELGGAFLFLKSIDSTVFLSLAPSQSMAQALMASAIWPYLEE